ncbi:MAG: hypothetical protein DSY82_02100 [Flavobacteriia bacterium]|nr:MAG: hypothetical protein DSY82_02100 [Flavobacteriia bacterium]
MKIKEKSINEFGKKVSRKLKKKVISNKRDFDILDCIPLIRGKQCMYIVDWTQYKMTYIRGLENMLGYDKEEFDIDHAFSCIHPEDVKIVYRIVKGTLKNALKIGFKEDNNYALVTYRVRKKDGSYINILRKTSPWELDDNGFLLSSLSTITDISFISNNNKVEWDIYANGLDNEVFKKNIFKEFIDFFTERELEIIHCMSRHCTSTDIANELFISLHTVKTHRKNIFKKANCHNRRELMNFCEKNGIL